MKKITGIFLAIVLAVTLIACADKKGEPLTPLEPATPIEPITPIEPPKEDEEIPNEFDIAWEGGTTTKLNNEDNDVLLGYNKDHLTVETNFVGRHLNSVGLNTDGTIRLYGNRDDGEGNILTITISDKVEVSELIVNFAEITGDTAKSNGIEVRVNGELLVLEDFNFLGNEVLEVKNAGMNVITIKNTHEGGSKNGQIWIKNITLRK